MKHVDDARFDAQRFEWRRTGVTADTEIDDAGLGTRAHWAVLNYIGAPITIRELAARPRSSVARTRTVGIVTLAEFDALLAFCDLSWAPEPSLRDAQEEDVARLVAAAVKNSKHYDDSLFDAQRAKWQRYNVTADSDPWDVSLRVQTLNAVRRCRRVPTTIRDLAAQSAGVFARTKGVGPLMLAEVTALIAFCGLTWAPEPTKEPR